MLNLGEKMVGNFIKYKEKSYSRLYSYAFITEIGKSNYDNGKLYGFKLPHCTRFSRMRIEEFPEIMIASIDDIAGRFPNYNIEGFKLILKYYSVPTQGWSAGRGYVRDVDAIKAKVKLSRFKPGVLVVIRNLQWGKTSWKHSYEGLSHIVSVDYDTNQIEVLAMWDKDLTATFKCHPKHLLLTLKGKREKPVENMVNRSNINTRLRAIQAKKELIKMADNNDAIAQHLKTMGWI